MPDDKATGSEATLGTPGDPASVHETAYSFAEEFARMGHDGPKILRMFQNPFYAGANDAYRRLGHTAAADIIDRCLAGTGRARVYGEAMGTAAAPESSHPKKARDHAD
jgi:hypothetical protein